ncbi:MAG TPA: RNA polymerase sigma-70 factor [Puia sp.]|jgi:RNA polymerase sigma-70 factor (ECF subfamily)
MEDAEYIRELQQRIAAYSDMKAYEALYKRLFAGAFRFAHSFVKSREAAEEIVSDAFIKLWEQGSRLAEVDNIKAYLLRIIRNMGLNYITRNYKVIQLNIDDLEFDEIIVWEDPEAIFLSGEAVARINDAIKSLPPQCRIIFQLVKIESLSYQETADVLGLSLSTIRNQMSIGLRKLSENLPELVVGQRIGKKGSL